MCNRLKKGTYILIIHNLIRLILKKHLQFVKLQANSKNNYAIVIKKGLFSCRH